MVPLCCHIMPSGMRCQSPAMRGHSLCYCHARQRRISADNGTRTFSIVMRPIEDRASALAAVNDIRLALADSRISEKAASIQLKAVQEARKLLPPEPEPTPENMVTDVAVTPDGALIAADPADSESPQAAPAPPTQAEIDASLDRHDAFACQLTPRRDNEYYMGMQRALVAREKMRNSLIQFEPLRKPSDPLPGDIAPQQFDDFEKKQEELKAIREERFDIR